MSVITISRGSYSGGKLLAEFVAQKLNYRCIDRDLIVQKAAAWGVPAEELKLALETPPTFLGQSRHTSYTYLAVIQATLLEEVKEGNAIYHGLAGHLLLKDATNVLRIRLIAPMEFRILKVQDRLKIDRRAAVDYIERMDEGRRKWTRSLYGLSWEDPSLYDVVINLDRLDIEQAADVVAAMVQEESFRETAETQQTMADLAVASRVRAKLATHSTTSQLELEINARKGAVTVRGHLLRPEQADQIGRIVRSVPGVATVDLHQLELAFTRM